jgi:iron(III) transport system ATP-binding protein
MNEGKIHQVGTPAEIYHNPCDRFVAEFVGQADFISGKVHSTKVATEIGEFALDDSIHVGDGAEVSVMLRPGDIDLVPAEFGTGTIDVVEFKGEDTVYSVRLRSGQVIHSSQHSSSVYPVGTRVMVQQILHT